MSFSSHAKVRILLSLVTILTVTSAFMVAFVAHGSTSRASGPSVITFQGSQTTISRAASLQLSLNATAQTPTTTAQSSTNNGTGPHLLFLPPRKRATTNSVTTASTALSHAPNTADRGMGADAGQLLNNFEGLNSVNSFDVNGFVLEPPDQGLCVGNLLGSKVVSEIINDVVTFYTPSGALFGPEENLNVFFGESPALNISDPRCVFDPTTQTWFFSVVVYTNSLTPNHSDLLVLHPNLSADVYPIDTTLPNNTAGQCPCFGDQPKLGIDKNNVYISVDQFGGAPNFVPETGADLFALSKSQLVAGAPVVNTAEFLNLSLAGIGVTALQPAITNSASNIEFLLNSFPYADEAQTMPNTISQLLGLWALSDTQAVTAGGTPKLSETLITSEIYGFPVPALTTNGLSLATFSNDSRMQQVQFINGQLWGALDSAVAVGNDPVTRDGAAWFEINPVVDSNGEVQGAQFTDQGYVAVKGKYLVYPAITTTFAGTTGISFSITSPKLNPSTGYVVRQSGSADFGNTHLTSKGSGPDIGFTCKPPFQGTFQQCRWGDYSWSALDPNGNDLWMAAEKTVPQVATQVIPGLSLQTNWGTRVYEVSG